MPETVVSQSVTIPGVTPADVFAHLADPANHVSAGDHPDVAGPIGATRLTGKGDTFGMRMRWRGLPYRITNTVVEFDQDRRIAWRHFGGHRWRYELAEAADGTTVTESFDISRLPGPAHVIYRRLYGFPDAYRRNLRESLDALRDRLAA
jgi:hypothetical protein